MELKLPNECLLYSLHEPLKLLPFDPSQEVTHDKWTDNRGYHQMSLLYRRVGCPVGSSGHTPVVI